MTWIRSLVSDCIWYAAWAGRLRTWVATPVASGRARGDNPTMEDQMDRRLSALEGIVVAAGEAILAIYNTDFSVMTKDDTSPLTEADLAANRIIVDGLRSLDPDIPILSEESASVPWAERSTWSRYWLVDPLDGTKEFVKKNGEFTVNIALIEDHRPTLGAIRVPVQATTFLGQLDRGAWRRQGDGELTAVRVRSAAPPLVIACSRSHPSAALSAFIAGWPDSETRALGSSLKFCRIAEGVVDIYPRLGPTSEWDTGAAQAVLEAAGGLVVRADGTPMGYNQKESLLNPFFFAIGDRSLLDQVLALASAEG